jgi:hypothetical protein
MSSVLLDACGVILAQLTVEVVQGIAGRRSSSHFRWGRGDEGGGGVGGGHSSQPPQAEARQGGEGPRHLEEVVQVISSHKAAATQCWGGGARGRGGALAEAQKKERDADTCRGGDAGAPCVSITQRERDIGRNGVRRLAGGRPFAQGVARLTHVTVTRTASV